MVNPIHNSLPPYSQYDIEVWALQRRWADPNPRVIASQLPSPFEVAKSQNLNASRKKKRSKQGNQKKSQEDNK